ncbi:hypothetical protein M8818_004963 [Zalaria obscura]|uniref:Uncharacterized protein n=1 Tax=Zalaria obscura TaxID=2024903 RepID=A0ACC3SDM1_9PEZI
MRLLFSFPLTFLLTCALLHASRPFKLSSVQETLSLPWTSEHRGDLADHEVPKDGVQHATDRDMHHGQNPEEGALDSSTLLKHVHTALGTMQSRYFELWIGTWPTSIDWTGAVLVSGGPGTGRSSCLHSPTAHVFFMRSRRVAGTRSYVMAA